MRGCLAAEGISKSYRKGKKQVLQSVSFSAKAGEIIGIIGANGSGKTTLLSILAGILPADSGMIIYEQNPVAGDLSHPVASEGLTSNDFRRLISFVPQENPLIEELSVRDNLRLWYGDRLDGLTSVPSRPASPDGLAQEQDTLFGILGIREFIDERVAHLSGGMKKRLSICCAVSMDQPILLMDEPGASLDLPAKERIGVYINHRKESGATVILSTHEEQEIRLCDRIFLLKDGLLEQVEFDGNVHKLVGMIA